LIDIGGIKGFHEFDEVTIFIIALFELKARSYFAFDARCSKADPDFKLRVKTFFAFNLMDSAITMILPQYDFSFYHEISPYFRIFYYLFLFLFFKKIIYKIEDNYRLNLGASAQKFFFLYAIYFILNFASSFLFPSLLWFLPPEIIFLPNFSGSLIAFSVSVCTGIFFGLHPAIKAARLDPVLALAE